MPARKPVESPDPIAELGEELAAMTDAQLARFMAACSEDDLTLAEHALGRVAAIGWRSSPLAMGVQLGHLDQMPHTELLSQKFVDAVEGRSPRQIWNVPARHGKSMIASQWGPTWAFDRDPTMKIALTSYGDALAQENSIAVRDLLVEHGDVLACRLRKDRRRQNRFVTDEGGGLIAAGVGSGLTGFGANGIVIDDPFKDWKEAHSEANRLRVWNWYRAVVRFRLEQTARTRAANIPPWIVVVMTRWHEDDLTGKLLDAFYEGDGEEWELVRLPAIAESPNPDSDDPILRTPDLLGRAPGEPLAPKLFDLPALRDRARAVGAYLTAGMEQQRPAPEEGTDIMRGWWKWYDEQPPRFDDSITSWDMKLKDTEVGDFVAGQAWGRTGSDFWGIDSLRGQWNQATTGVAIALLSVRNPTIRRHIIENTGNGPEVMGELRKARPGYQVSEEIRSQLGMTEAEARKVNSLLRRGMTGLIPENVKGKKTVRARAHAGTLEGGNVHLPNGRAWADSLVNEAAAFPNGTHDDQVDAWSQAMKRLSGSAATVSRPSSRRTGKPKPASRAGQVRRPSARGAPLPGPAPRIRRLPPRPGR